MRIFGLAICALTFLSWPIVAFSQAETPGTMLASNPVFQVNCAKCHGKTADGRHFAGPSLLSEKVRSTSTDDLRNIISNGKGHMPKFAGKLTPEEIDTLTQQIKSSKK